LPVNLDDTLVRNLTVAFRVCDEFAAANGLDPMDVRDVTATMLVTESGGGYIYANDGQGFREPSEGHTPWNWDAVNNRQIGTPETRARMREILRRSLDLPHDKVGSNGRSTGPAQQLSADTGGAWGPMADTMQVDKSVLMFLNAVDWSNRDQWYPNANAPGRKLMANWQTAMLLRVQRPLSSEVDANYGAGQLSLAQQIARDPRFTSTEKDWYTMATPEEVKQAFKDALGDALGRGTLVSIKKRNGTDETVGVFITDALGAILDEVRDLPEKIAEAVWKYKADSLVTGPDGKTITEGGYMKDYVLYTDLHTYETAQAAKANTDAKKES
jgi:hypothetical protein